jgi:hypothetical protein
MPVRENEHRMHRSAIERLSVHVTFNQHRGYEATAQGLPIITALSLANLRRQIDARVGKHVIPQLQLDRLARQERDARRRDSERRRPEA